MQLPTTWLCIPTLPPPISGPTALAEGHLQTSHMVLGWGIKGLEGPEGPARVRLVRKGLTGLRVKTGLGGPAAGFICSPVNQISPLGAENPRPASQRGKSGHRPTATGSAIAASCFILGRSASATPASCPRSSSRPGPCLPLTVRWLFLLPDIPFLPPVSQPLPSHFSLSSHVPSSLTSPECWGSPQSSPLSVTVTALVTS